MELKDYAEDHRNELLSLMTPLGLINIQAHDLLEKEVLYTNPGCSGNKMEVQSMVVREMNIIDYRVTEKYTAILVE